MGNLKCPCRITVSYRKWEKEYQGDAMTLLHLDAVGVENASLDRGTRSKQPKYEMIPLMDIATKMPLQ